jgi:hypothetical protein
MDMAQGHAAVTGQAGDIKKPEASSGFFAARSD